MKGVTSSGVKVGKITQITMVVEDLKTVAENYWSILGIGPWTFYALEYPQVHDRKYIGKPNWSRERACCAELENVRFELVQPVDGSSQYLEFLQEHGEGLHHLQFVADDFDETVDILTRVYGFESQSSEVWGVGGGQHRHDHLSIEPLACLWEVVERGGDIIPYKVSCYPETKEESPAKVKVANINQVALVVNNLRKAVEDYWAILGIGPWAIYEWKAPLVYDKMYRGERVWTEEIIAVTDVGGIQLELCQPVRGPSVYRDFLAEHGEGLHHMNFFVPDVDATATALSEQGFCSIQSGRHGPAECRNAFNYLDTKPLRAIWEPTHYDESQMGGEAIYYPTR